MEHVAVQCLAASTAQQSASTGGDGAQTDDAGQYKKHVHCVVQHVEQAPAGNAVDAGVLPEGSKVEFLATVRQHHRRVVGRQVEQIALLWRQNGRAVAQVEGRQQVCVCVQVSPQDGHRNEHPSKPCQS